jgi:response regulator of citrate/malate metabolism
LDKALQKGIIIIMLSTSANSEDIAKGMKYTFVSDYIIKPLTSEIIDNITKKYFNG